MSETEQKLKTIRSFMEGRSVDALHLRLVSSFAWATCGASSYVNTAASNGAGSLLITRTEQFVITDNIEASRMKQEEKLDGQGWEFRIAPWYEPNPAFEALSKGLRVGADYSGPSVIDLSAEIARQRSALTPEEGTRFKVLSKLCAGAVDRAIRAVKPGMTEYQIGGLLAAETEASGVQMIVNLIASDERIFKFRHPLPTDKKLDRYCMMILCGRKWGLVCSLTRFVHFGALTDELREKSGAVARVDAELFAATRPGATLQDIFRKGAEAYRECGFADEWQLHHQGGPAGYEPREFVGTPTATDVVLAGQAYAWNPSITGSKSEDTILIGNDRNEVISAIPGWPVVKVEVGGQVIERPAILEIE